MSVSRENGCQDLLVQALRILAMPITDIRIAELGDQRIKHGHKYVASLKSYFEFFGAHHVSIDRNGRAGALPYDLNQPLSDPSLAQSFHLVTNFGTTEHVTNQCSVFRNIHWLCALGGLMVHHVPLRDVDHGNFQYSIGWFTALARDQHYSIQGASLFSRPNQGPSYASVILQRTTLEPFDEVCFNLPFEAQRMS